MTDLKDVILSSGENKDLWMQFRDLVMSTSSNINVMELLHAVCTADKLVGSGKISYEKLSTNKLSKVQLARVLADTLLLNGYSTSGESQFMLCSTSRIVDALGSELPIYRCKGRRGTDADLDECMSVFNGGQQSGDESVFKVIVRLYRAYKHIVYERDIVGTFPVDADLRIYRGQPIRDLPLWVTEGRWGEGQRAALSEIMSVYDDDILRAYNEKDIEKISAFMYKQFLVVLMKALTAMNEKGFVALSYKRMSRAFDVCDCVPSIGHLTDFYRGTGNACKELYRLMDLKCRKYDLKRDGEYVLLLLSHLVNTHPLGSLEEVRKHG